jgi:hypothetical protein
VAVDTLASRATSAVVGRTALFVLNCTTFRAASCPMVACDDDRQRDPVIPPRRCPGASMD